MSTYQRCYQRKYRFVVNELDLLVAMNKASKNCARKKKGIGQKPAMSLHPAAVVYQQHLEKSSTEHVETRAP